MGGTVHGLPVKRPRRHPGRLAAGACLLLGLLLSTGLSPLLSPGLTGCAGTPPEEAATGSAEREARAPIEIEIAAGGAVASYEFTGQVRLRVRSRPGDPPRSFTLNGVRLASANALLEFDGAAVPPTLTVAEGAVMVLDPVQAAPGEPLHGLAGFVLLRAGQRLSMVPGALRIETSTAPEDRRRAPEQ